MNNKKDKTVFRKKAATCPKTMTIFTINFLVLGFGGLLSGFWVFHF